MFKFPLRSSISNYVAYSKKYLIMLYKCSAFAKSIQPLSIKWCCCVSSDKAQNRTSLDPLSNVFLWFWHLFWCNFGQLRSKWGGWIYLLTLIVSCSLQLHAIHNLQIQVNNSAERKRIYNYNNKIMTFMKDTPVLDLTYG